MFIGSLAKQIFGTSRTSSSSRCPFIGSIQRSRSIIFLLQPSPWATLFLSSPAPAPVPPPPAPILPPPPPPSQCPTPSWQQPLAAPTPQSYAQTTVAMEPPLQKGADTNRATSMCSSAPGIHWQAVLHRPAHYTFSCPGC